MGIKTTKTTANRSSLYSELDIFSETALSRDDKADVADQVGRYLVEEINASLASSRSPVEGESFPRLSADYKKQKVADGFAGVPDLERSGALKDALDFQATSKGIKIGFFSDKENAGKADGHNNFSGSSLIPQRRFLPDVGQKFKSSIEKDIKDIISEAVANSLMVTQTEVDLIESKADFNSFIEENFPDLTRSEAIRTIIASDIYDLFVGSDALEFLGG
jgi:phage gpG-like protein